MPPLPGGPAGSRFQRGRYRAGRDGSAGARGYGADLLAVDGDPLTDPAALTAVRAACRAGVRVR